MGLSAYDTQLEFGVSDWLSELLPSQPPELDCLQNGEPVGTGRLNITGSEALFSLASSFWMRECWKDEFLSLRFTTFSPSLTDYKAELWGCLNLSTFLQLDIFISLLGTSRDGEPEPMFC